MTTNDQVRVRPARGDEAATISELAIRSKGFWDYSEEFIEACRAELTFTPEECVSGDVGVAEFDARVAGFYVLDGTPPRGELRALFVDPPWIGSGVGRLLLQDALAVAGSRGLSSLVLDADPGAEGFYARFGARRIGEVPSGSIPGRSLPQMELDVETINA